MFKHTVPYNVPVSALMAEAQKAYEAKGLDVKWADLSFEDRLTYADAVGFGLYTKDEEKTDEENDK